MMEFSDDSRQRTESIRNALEGSSMVGQDTFKQRTFSGTIWDTPEELEKEKEQCLLNGKKTHTELSNGNGTQKQHDRNSQNQNTEMSTAM